MNGALIYNSPAVYLGLSLFLLCCGLVGLLSRKSLIAMLISVELILNGAGLNLVALNRFVATDPGGQVFALFIMGLAAAEVAVALGVIILIFKRRKTIAGDSLAGMKG